MTPRPSTPLSPLERIRFPSGKTSSSREADVPPPPSSFCYEFELERVPKKKRQSCEARFLPRDRCPRIETSRRLHPRINSASLKRAYCTSNGSRARSLFPPPFHFSFSFLLFFFSLSLPLTSEVIKRGGVSLISTILFPPPPPSLLSLFLYDVPRMYGSVVVSLL